VTEYRGEVVNFYGDGALCTFHIPIDGVQCAIDLQREFQGTLQVPVRIGLHAGTVTVEDERIFGDSVNITSRIESMAVPGSILFSKKVRDDIKNNPDLILKSLGSFQFKNVEESLEILSW